MRARTFTTAATVRCGQTDPWGPLILWYVAPFLWLLAILIWQFVAPKGGSSVVVLFTLCLPISYVLTFALAISRCGIGS